MTQASAHFSFAELTHTDTGLPNDPGVGEGASLVRLAEVILEPMRALAGPLKVNSGFRSPAVNAKIGGVANSQHMKGEAADLVPLEIGIEDLFERTKASEIPFDQLILEPTWVHVSVAPLGRAPRRECLKAHRNAAGVMVYEKA